MSSKNSCAQGISKDAKVIRCGGESKDRIDEYSVYGPKVIALIGEPDGVLADRCLPVPMRRKVEGEQVKHYRSRVVEPVGAALHKKLEQWATDHQEEVAQIYDRLEPFDIANDRMADLLTPLQSVLEAWRRRAAWRPCRVRQRAGRAGPSGEVPNARRAIAGGLPGHLRQYG